MFSAADYDTIQDAVDAAAASVSSTTGVRGAQVRITGRGVFTIDTPIILPRTGTTPSRAVSLVGDGPRHSKIAGSAIFPAGRALIEWEATVARTWHQEVRDLALTLPNVAGVRAIHYAKTGAGTTAADFNNERAQFTFENLLIENNNGYHDSLIKIEGQAFFSAIRNVEADGPPIDGLGNNRTLANNDTTLFEFDSGLHGASVSNDITGFSYGVIEQCRAGTRRGGWFQLFKGRAKLARIADCWAEGGREKPGLHLINSFGVDIENVNNEGRSASMILIEDSENITLDRQFVATMDPAYPDRAASTAYTAEVSGVVVPGWRNNVDPPAPANNNWYKCTVSGTTGASEPAWPTTAGLTVVDGTVTWECMGPSVNDVLAFSNTKHIRLNTMAGNKPTAGSRGVRAVAFAGCINVDADRCILAGHPDVDVEWGGSTGTGTFYGVRDDVWIRYGTDPTLASRPGG